MKNSALRRCNPLAEPFYLQYAPSVVAAAAMRQALLAEGRGTKEERALMAQVISLVQQARTPPVLETPRVFHSVLFSMYSLSLFRARRRETR